MLLLLIFTFLYYFRGDSANAVPHDRYYAAEFPTFEEIAEVISPEVQWISLALEKLRRMLPHQYFAEPPLESSF